MKQRRCLVHRRSYRGEGVELLLRSDQDGSDMRTSEGQGSRLDALEMKPEMPD